MTVTLRPAAPSDLPALTAIKREAGLWTAADNHRPRRIYQAAGWRTDGATRHRSFGGIAFTEVRYRLPLMPNR